VKKTDKRRASPRKKIFLMTLCILGVLCIALISFSPNVADIYAQNDNEAFIGQQGNVQDAEEQPQEAVPPEMEDRQDVSFGNQDGSSVDELPENLPEDFGEDTENDSDDDPADDISAGLYTPDEPVKYDGQFELPVRGATGWAAARLNMHSEPDGTAESLLVLQPGQSFLILDEHELWWNIRLDSGDEGWVRHRHCFINLPDIIPSIIYNITNAYSSVKRSNMYDIPNITGYVLYDAHSFNHRLGRYEFIVPVLYYTSPKIMQAQQAALDDGNTLIIYEAFRPRSTQRSVVDNLRSLMNTNRTVYRAINSPPWSVGWFIGTNLSNHQRGVAFDMSLGRIAEEEIGRAGEFSYRRIADYVELEMPTAMHELSIDAVLLSRPVSANVQNAWRDIPFAETMTEAAILLVQYATDAGLTPLASEWWHFNDLAGRRIADEVGITGEFYTETIYSILP